MRLIFDLSSISHVSVKKKNEKLYEEQKKVTITKRLRIGTHNQKELTSQRDCNQLLNILLVRQAERKCGLNI